jgi:hypothetical protein
MTISQEIFHARIYRKNARAQHGDAQFVACAVEMHRDVCQEPLHDAPFDARIYKKNAGAQDWDAQFVRARAVEMHMDMQEPFYGRIRRKNAGEQMDPLDLTPALTPTERTPQCGHTVGGKRCKVSKSNFNK